MDYPRIDTESPRRTPAKGLGKYVPHQNVRERTRRLKQLAAKKLAPQPETPRV